MATRLAGRAPAEPLQASAVIHAWVCRAGDGVIEGCPFTTWPPDFAGPRRSATSLTIAIPNPPSSAFSGTSGAWPREATGTPHRVRHGRAHFLQKISGEGHRLGVFSGPLLAFAKRSIERLRRVRLEADRLSLRVAFGVVSGCSACFQEVFVGSRE